MLAPIVGRLGSVPSSAIVRCRRSEATPPPLSFLLVDLTSLTRIGSLIVVYRVHLRGVI